MKMILFGIALILFAILMVLSGVWLPVIRDLMGREESTLAVGLVGLLMVGIGTFRKD